jgi:hypothetical protein
MAIEIKRLSAPRISPDGAAVKFTAHAVKGANLVVVFPTEQLEVLIRLLIELSTSTKISGSAAYHGKEIWGTKDEQGWTDAPHTILVRRFSQIDNPDTGGFFLRLNDVQDRVFDVSFHPDQVEILKRMILDDGTPKSAPGVH